MSLQKELANNPNCPHMCAYKLVTVEFRKLGLQTQVEALIHRVRNASFFLYTASWWPICAALHRGSFIALS